MKPAFVYLIISIFILGSCEKGDVKPGNPKGKFVPTDVLVKTRNNYTIDKVFTFINSFDHDVEYISNSFYVSSMSPDSLQYVLDYLNKKSYTNDHKDWPVSGYLHYQTQVIHIFPRLYEIRNRKNQLDWLETMKLLKLTEVTDREVGGSIIYFHVPKTTEEEWVKKFKKYSFVEWAEVNAYVQIIL